LTRFGLSWKKPAKAGFFARAAAMISLLRKVIEFQ